MKHDLGSAANYKALVPMNKNLLINIKISVCLTSTMVRSFFTIHFKIPKPLINYVLISEVFSVL